MKKIEKMKSRIALLIMFLMMFVSGYAANDELKVGYGVVDMHHLTGFRTMIKTGQ